MLSTDSKLTTSELQTFRLILDAGPISRVKIAEKLRLTRAAVTVAVQQLQKKDYIIEAGKGDTKAGRREVLLASNPDSGLFISIHLALKYASVGLVNLNGTILYKTRFASSSKIQAKEILEQAMQAINNYIKDHNISKNRIWGIGVSLPGVVDYEKGVALESTLHGWANFNIREVLSKYFDCPIVVENDVKTLTLGEFKFSTGLDVNHMVCLWMEDGIGAGIIINGQLYRGYTSSAGEIGFNEFIRPLAKGNTLLIHKTPRFWGDVLSFSNIKSAVEKALDENWHSVLSRDITLENFVEAVAANDPLATHIFRSLGEILGTVCCNLIYTFNPQVLLLSGPVFRSLPGLADVIHKHVSKGHLRTPIEAASIRISNLGEDSITIGGALLLLEYLFKMHE